MQFLDYLEDNQIDGTRSDLSDVVKELKQGSASQILDLFREMLRQKKSQHGVSTENVVDGKRKRKQSEPVNVQPETKRAKIAGAKAKASGVAKFGIGERVEADTVVFGSKYAEANPGSITGTVVAKESGGIIRVLWDEDSDKGVDAALRSHWKHLKPVQGSEEVNQAHVAYLLKCSLGPVSRMETKVFHIFMSLERAMTRREMYESNKTDLQYPKSWWECLVLDDWRSWIQAIHTEMKGWRENQAVLEVRIEDVEDGATILGLEELYLIKRNGKYKHRCYARGDRMKPKDYLDTRSHTVASETMRFCFSLAAACKRLVKQGDVVTAYLQSEQRKPMYSYKPSYADYLDADSDDLSTLRQGVLQTLKSHGIAGFKKLNRRNRHDATHVWKLCKAVYGLKDAGAAFEQHKEWVFMTLGAKRLWTDRAVYYFTEPDPKDGTNRWILFWSHTDDFGFFGSDDAIEDEFMVKISKLMKMEWQGVCKDYTSVEVSQDLDLGIVELRQPTYWEQLGKQYSQYGVKPPFKTFTPLPDGIKMPDSTPALHEAAKHLPYRELVGSLMYPAVMTKLEMRYAISQLGRFMSNWTCEHWNLAIGCLKYGCTTRWYGVIYSLGLDKHGVNVLYAYADSSFSHPHSHGGRTVMFNGGAIINTSKKHSTIDTSSTGAEFAELFHCALDIKRMRNLMQELGMEVQEPTLCYQDNQPTIKIAEGAKTAGAVSTKAMNIKYAKVQEMIQDDQELYLKWLSTVDMVADLNSKALGRKQFEYLRDIMTGYALVKLRYPKYFADRKDDPVVGWVDRADADLKATQVRAESSSTKTDAVKKRVRFGGSV